MSLLSGVATALVGRSTGTGAAATETTSGDTGLLSTVGTIVGGLIGVPGVGTVLGTIGDEYLETRTGRATDVVDSGAPGGRATNALVAAGSRYAGNAAGALGLVGIGRGMARSARFLTRAVGVLGAAEALGLTVEQTAYLATRPARRRGITAASLRTTRRTLRQVASIRRSFSKIKCH